MKVYLHVPGAPDRLLGRVDEDVDRSANDPETEEAAL